MDYDAMSALAQDILRRLVLREGVVQAFVFNSEGDPFWAGRRPISADELQILDEAAALIVEAERSMAKPFLAVDEAGRFSAAALEPDTDLYLVLIHGATAIEARLAVYRAELRAALSPIRNESLRPPTAAG